MTSDESALLAANEAFYLAFRDHDPDAMEALWAHEAPVTCVHPGWAPLREREVIMRSWRAIFRGVRAPHVVVEEPRAAVLGPVGYVVCIERLSDPQGDDAGALVATNLFVREGGAWRIAHHQAGPLAAADDDDDDDEDTPPDPGGLLN